MKTKDALTAVGGIRILCSLLNMGRSAVYQWGDEVPEARQDELEVKTLGKLKSDFTLSRNKHAKNDVCP